MYFTCNTGNDDVFLCFFTNMRMKKTSATATAVPCTVYRTEITIFCHIPVNRTLY
jgi:hypothetical protein